ncbi:MAG: CPBP family intramembrane metalloprotease [Defluviitaleaceae bacterium]|nr:CPBP family intramembrane metalloprotease [Defluviitaleaceae bacterium]
MGHRRGSAFMLFLLFFRVIFILTFGLVVIPAISPGVARTVFGSPWFIIFQQVMVFILPLGIWLFLTKEKLTEYVPNMKLGKINIIFIFFLSIFLQPIMMLLSGISGLFFPNQVGAMVGGMAAQPLWLMLLALAVTPAICEEIVFRGYIQSAYRNLPFTVSALLNGLFFAMIHLSLQQFLYAFAMGVIFAYMVHYSRSIRAGILMHFIMNASQISLARLVRISVPESLAAPPQRISFAEQLHALMGMGVIALVAAPCVVILFRSFLSHNRQRNIEYDMQKEIWQEPIESSAEAEASNPTRFRYIDPFIPAVVALYVFIMLVF